LPVHSDYIDITIGVTEERTVQSIMISP